MKNTVIILSSLLIIPIFAISQSTIKVDGSATGLNNGTSWVDAFRNINDAILVAQAGDTIWVASGVYRPTNDGNRDSSFVLKNKVGLYGGFAGSETALSQRNWNLNQTILSGDIGLPNDNTDNSYNVVFGIGLDTTTAIDGFIIEKGAADDTNPAEENLRRKQGGGMNLRPLSATDCKPIIRHCIFRNNSASNSGGALYAGGTNLGDAIPHISFCTFVNNSGSGVTLECRLRKAQQHPIKISNCFFGDNNNSGVNIFVAFSAGSLVADFDRDTFNSPGGNGAFTILGLGLVTNKTKVRNSVFSQNKFGRVTIDGFGESETLITGCTFSENKRFEIGAYDFESAKVIFEKNIFEKNRHSFVYCIGELQVADNLVSSSSVSFSSSSTNCINNVFKKNRVGFSAFTSGHFQQSLHYQDTLVFDYSNQSFQSCSFIDCKPGVYTNAFFQPQDTFLFNSCLFTSASNNFSIIDTLTEPYPYVRASHCVFQDADCQRVLFNAPAAFCDGNNIFGANLIFADTAGGDFHLLPCSDGVNAGDLSAIVDGEILTDLNGLPRIAHGLPDVGAFETAQEATPLPQISASIFPASSAFATDGAIVVELLNGDSDDYSFLWNTGTTGFVIENIAAGIYTVTITDTTGCYVIHSFELGTVGTSEPGTGAISVFPNPVQAGSMLHFSQPFSGILKIEDISGRELSGLVSIGAQYIKIPEVPSGAYIATFQAESGQITALRLFIQ